MSAFPVASLFAEVRALTRDGVVPPHLIDALQHRLEDVEDVLQGATVVTLGLLSAARGERRHARELLESVLWLDPRAVSPGALECALGWLVTDAAAEGAWPRVRQFAARAPDTAAMRFFRLLAEQVLGGVTGAPSADDAYQLPVEARRFAEAFPGRVSTLSPSGRGRQFPEPVAAMFAELLDLEGGDLNHAARAVSAVLQSPRLRERLMERATLLGGGSPDEALDELRTLCEAALGDALMERAPADEPLLQALAARRRAALIEEFDARLDRLTDACQDGTTPPMTEVWREFVAIRSRYARAVALSEPAERGWPHHVVLRLMRYFGTWLRLTMRERPFAHAVFRFLEVEATAAGDEKSAQLARASLELCLPFEHPMPPG